MPDEKVDAEPTEVEETPEAEPAEQLIPDDVGELAEFIDNRAREDADAVAAEGAAVDEAEEAEPEPDPQAPEEAEAPPVGEEPPATPPETPLGEIESQLDEANQQADKFKRIAGREAGRSGHLEQEVTKLRTLVENLTAAKATPTEDYGTAGSAEAGEIGLLAQAVVDLRERVGSQNAFLTQQAIGAAGRQLIRKYPADFEAFGQEIGELLVKDHKADFEAITDAADPIAAGQRTSELVESVYWQVKREKLSAELEERRKAKADQASSLRERKLAAAPAQTGGGKAAPRAKPKTLDTLEDLRREINRRASGAA